MSIHLVSILITKDISPSQSSQFRVRDGVQILDPEALSLAIMHLRLRLPFFT
jgi:hypothetical protein